MPEGQPHIYYAAGESTALLAKLPAAERVLEKGYDVLFLTDDVDEFALQMMHDYDKKSSAMSRAAIWAWKARTKRRRWRKRTRRTSPCWTP